MNRRLKTLLTLIAVHAILVLTALPVFATEGGDTGADTGGKLTIPSDPHDRVGLILIVFIGVVVLLALANAVKNLRGERPQADGKIRWR